jgi:hypothetical protein
MSDGWMPGVQHIPTGRFGYPQGTHGQLLPDVFCQHTVVGWKATIDQIDQYRNIHFCVGLDGSKSQYVSIRDAAWGNGITGSIDGFDRSDPKLAAWETLPGAEWSRLALPYGIRHYLNATGLPSVPNMRSISIEREDGGNPEADWPEAQRQAIAEIMDWCQSDLGQLLGYVGHVQIEGGVDRKGCPGSKWPRADILGRLEDDMPTIDEIKQAMREVRDEPLAEFQGRNSAKFHNDSDDYTGNISRPAALIVKPDPQQWFVSGGKRHKITSETHLSALVKAGVVRSGDPVAVTAAELESIPAG